MNFQEIADLFSEESAFLIKKSGESEGFEIWKEWVFAEYGEFREAPRKNTIKWSLPK